MIEIIVTGGRGAGRVIEVSGGQRERDYNWLVDYYCRLLTVVNYCWLSLTVVDHCRLSLTIVDYR